MDVLLGYAAAVEAGSLADGPGEAGVEFLELGVGKAASATALTARLTRGSRLDLVVLFGVCGAYRDLEPGELCLVTRDRLADEGVMTRDAGFRDLRSLGLEATTIFSMDEARTAEAAAALGVHHLVEAATVSTCSGTDALSDELVARTGADIETMEGAAVALVCQQWGVPLVQLRCVSNKTGDRALASWDLHGACTNLQAAVRRLLEGPWSG